MVENIFLVLVFIGLFAIFFCFFMLFRNDWVYRKRIEIINKNMNEYDILMPYEYMVSKFWCWDINKMKKENLE
jgi:vacuolar-type H+-ATPase subunit I/STV1